MGAIPRELLEVTKSQELVTKYQWNAGETVLLCRVWAFYTHHFMRGETQTAGINMACIEGFDIFALGDIKVGKGKNWSLVSGASSA